MRLVVISNRLPVILDQEDGQARWKPASGGLITALAPLLRRWEGLWIGWPGEIPEALGSQAEAFAALGREQGFEIAPVQISPEEEKGFYYGFSNEIIWPLFHDLQSRCNFVPEYWTSYLTVQEKFVQTIVEKAQADDFLWVQDYHLMGLGRRLRDGGVTNRIGFFLHIPFPPPDIFMKLPWREDVLSGLLGYDLVGFQTPRDRENFFDCVRHLLPAARMRLRTGLTQIEYEGHCAAVGVFPIGIPYADFAELAASPAVTQRVRAMRKNMPTGQIIVSVDRLDYTKGVPDRLKAFELALKRYPELHRKITLLQLLIPSRQAVPEYQELKAQIEQAVTRVNGQFTQPGWVPIQHVFRSVEREELLSYYRVADMALITPLKDGMNLVAKEYCACQIDGDGVLILSEFAGAAVQLGRHAVLVNPYDFETVASAIRLASSMTANERRPDMQKLRRIIEREDVFWWADKFLTACGVTMPKDAPANGKPKEEELHSRARVAEVITTERPVPPHPNENASPPVKRRVAGRSARRGAGSSND